MDKEKLIGHLKKAISSFERGISLFENKNYINIPKGKEKEILAHCRQW